MNQNSNIRRIDELGRIVIPKDIRKKLHIKENETLEIFIDNDEIRIKKYSSLPDILDYINYMLDIGHRTTNNKYILTDRNKILAANDSNLLNISLEKKLEDLVLYCKEEFNNKDQFNFNNNQIQGYFNLLPIIIDNDRQGLLIEYNENQELKSSHIIKIFKNLIEMKLNNYWF